MNSIYMLSCRDVIDVVAVDVVDVNAVYSVDVVDGVDGGVAVPPGGGCCCFCGGCGGGRLRFGRLAGVAVVGTTVRTGFQGSVQAFTWR